MNRFRLSARAQRDIQRIGQWYHERNPDAADKISHALIEACEFVAERPEAGFTRTELTSRPVRFWPVKPRYQIVYRDNTTPIYILRVVCDQQDIAALL